MILIDTNILLRSHPSDPHYVMVERTLAKLKQDRQTLCITPQNLVEYWVVATRPVDSNGLGMPATAAVLEIQRLRNTFHLLEGLPGIADTWEALVSRHKVLGKQAHDAHLVAAMIVHGVKQLLTFNGSDFVRFPGIVPLDPAQV